MKRGQSAEKANERTLWKISYVYNYDVEVHSFDTLLSPPSLSLFVTFSIWHCCILVFCSIAMYRLKNAHINCVTEKFTIIFEWTATTSTTQGNGVQVTQCVYTCVRVFYAMVKRRSNNLYIEFSMQTNNITLKKRKNTSKQERNWCKKESMYCVVKHVNDATTQNDDGGIDLLRQWPK